MKRVLTAIVMLLVCRCMYAQPEAVQNILLSHPQTKYANIGIYIRNTRTGEVIESYRPRNSIPPASVIKLLTTATALEIFGSAYRYPTTLEYSGYVQDSTLHGDLYIVGHGDPMLGCLKQGQGFLASWVKAVRNAGIKRIDGRIVADMSFFDGDALNPAWLWEDAGNYYAPGVFALSYMDNTMNILLRSSEPGSVAEVLRTVPEVPGMTFDNHIRCTKTEEDGAYVSGAPYHLHRHLTGSVPSNRGDFGVKGDLPNPGLLLAQHFTKSLRQAGIAVNNDADYISEAMLLPRHNIYTHLSDSLGAIVGQTNMHSVNLYAESMFRSFGQRISLPCTIRNAELVMRGFWRNRGIDLTSATVKDGCGLAPQDAVSAEAFVSLLEYMTHSQEYPAFYASLPVSGKSGTLRGFLDGTPLEGRVHAKSGTIAGTKNYAGYIELPDGQQWTFAILINSATGKMRNVQPVIEKYLLDVYRRNK